MHFVCYSGIIPPARATVKSICIWYILICWYWWTLFYYINRIIYILNLLLVGIPCDSSSFHIIIFAIWILYRVSWILFSTKFEWAIFCRALSNWMPFAILCESSGWSVTIYHMHLHLCEYFVFLYPIRSNVHTYLIIYIHDICVFLCLFVCVCVYGCVCVSKSGLNLHLILIYVYAYLFIFGFPLCVCVCVTILKFVQVKSANLFHILTNIVTKCEDRCFMYSIEDFSIWKNGPHNIRYHHGTYDHRNHRYYRYVFTKRKNKSHAANWLCCFEEKIPTQNDALLHPPHLRPWCLIH